MSRRCPLRSSPPMPDTLVAPVAASSVPLLRGAAVAGVGAALPSAVVPTSAIAERLGVTDQWIESRTGVMERRRAGASERLADFAARAGADALAHAGLPASDLDLVIVATSTADDRMPATAPLVAGAVGAVHAGAFDLDAACNGWLTALNMGAAQIESGRAESALVIGADFMSRLVNPDDRRTAALFGDGAGACVLVPSDAARIGPTVLRSDATGAPFIRSSGEPASLVMDGHETFKAAVARLAEVTLDALRLARLALRDVDLFVYHQANARILVAVGEKLGVDPARVVNAIGTLGNTSSASIPLALSVAERDGLLRPGMRLLLAAFGAGFTWGATTVEWGAEPAASRLGAAPDRSPVDADPHALPAGGPPPPPRGASPASSPLGADPDARPLGADPHALPASGPPPPPLGASPDSSPLGADPDA